MNPEKCKIADDEIAYRLEHDIVKPSSSNESSPCGTVPKPDDCTKFRTDFKKEYGVT